jgi:hypothetical protein
MKNGEKEINSFQKLIDETRIEVLLVSIAIIAALFIFISGVIINLFPGISKEFGNACFLITLLLLSLSGLLQVYKKESPGFINPIRGKLAVINGSIIYLLFFGSAILIEVLHFLYI